MAASKGCIQLQDRNAQPSLRIIADHARAATFLISDGLIPSNEGRGYVLRKIIRRALRHVKLLKIPSRCHLFPNMAFAVRDLMGDAYPDLKELGARASNILAAEEARFDRTVIVGLEKLEGLVQHSGDPKPNHGSI